MPLPDFRRYTGPEIPSKDYKEFIRKKKKSAANERQRVDGRKDSEHRSIYVKTGVLTQAKGSAYIERGNTKVIVGVYGPREVPKRSESSSVKGILSVEYKEATFSSRNKRRNHQRDDQEREISLMMTQALESTVCLHLYPKSKIDIFVTVIDNDGSAVASALTASGLALADACINLFDVITGSSLVVLGDRTLLDPTAEEEDLVGSDDYQSTDGTIVVGYLPSLDQVASVIQDGVMEQNELSTKITELIESARESLPVVHQCLIDAAKEKKMESE